MAKRNAVVVTHTRLRQTGTVVAEAVSQLRVAGFGVAIIDNTEAPDFGVQPPCVSDDTEISPSLSASSVSHETLVSVELGIDWLATRRNRVPVRPVADQWARRCHAAPSNPVMRSVSDSATV